MRVVEEKEWRVMNIVEVCGDGVVWKRTATATAERRHPLSLLPAPCSQLPAPCSHNFPRPTTLKIMLRAFCTLSFYPSSKFTLP